MIGDEIKKLRLELNMSCSSFSKGLNISASALSNIESNNYAPSSDLIHLISKTHSVDLHKLLSCEVPTDESNIKEQNALVGKRIKKYRKEYGYTQSDLAEKLGYASSGQICFIEGGKRGMSRDKLVQFCKLFNVPIEELLFEEPSKAKRYNEGKYDKLIQDFTAICYSINKPAIFSSVIGLIEACVKDFKPSQNTDVR
jgi:transcriptional regulator with XRE-family HTH domain